MRRKKTPSNAPTSFLQKTYEILCDNSLSSIVSWNDDGKSFSVKNVKEFSEQVLPMYFKHSNFASFVRQLNMYNFHKVREEENVFYHSLFQRDKQELMKDITRKTSEAAVMSQTMLSKADCSGLLSRLYGLHAHQQVLEGHVESLTSKYQEICCQNQMLIKELYFAQEREERIEKLLVMLASFISNRQTPDFYDWRGVPMLANSPKSPEPDFLEDLEEDPIDFFLSQL
jgi:heat shock transcription factor 1